jgi:hypothetical protein
MTDHRTLRELDTVERFINEYRTKTGETHQQDALDALKRLREALLAPPAPSPQACERHAKLGLFEPCCDDCYKAEYKAEAAREAPADAPPPAPRQCTSMELEEALYLGEPAAEPPAPTGSARDDEPSGR